MRQISRFTWSVFLKYQ